MKPCTRCGETKPFSEFYRQGPSGWRAECKRCISIRNARDRARRDPAVVAAYMTEYHRVNIDKWRMAKWRERIGPHVTTEAVDALMEEQKGRCSICSTPFDELDRTPHLDHDHVTGALRGFLCQNCNLMLGHAKDDPARLRAAIDYLEKNS